MAKITVIDSGICNLFNIVGALKKVGGDVTVTRNASEISSASRLLLPGVGAFQAGMKSLQEHKLVTPILNYVKSGKPFFGICLGMQLIMDTSSELGNWEGLGIVPGEVVRLGAGHDALAVKIPQMGWNTLETPKGSSWKKTILDDLEPQSFAYFVHSFYVRPRSTSVVLAETLYGDNRFCSVLRHENVSACQLHPERSGLVGLRILQNFLEKDS